MFGHKFKCDKCEHSFLAGATRFLETDALPGAHFSDTGDQKGYWVNHNGVTYCGPCSDKEFPQILAEGVKFKVTGAACF